MFYVLLTWAAKKVGLMSTGGNYTKLETRLSTVEATVGVLNERSESLKNAMGEFRGEVRASTAAQNQTLNDVQSTLSRMEGAQQERDRREAIK